MERSPDGAPTAQGRARGQSTTRLDDELVEPVGFRCDVRFVNDRAWVTVRGDVDVITAPQVLQAAVAALDRTGSVALDLGDVTFINSSGLGAVLAVQYAAAESGGAFALPSPSRPVRQAIEAAGLRAHFAVTPLSPIPRWRRVHRRKIA